MLVTSKEAKNMLRKLEDNENIIWKRERDNCVFRAATNENPEELRPDYDFWETSNSLMEIQKEMIMIKHKINVFNSTTEVGDTGLTIDQILVRMPQITRELSRLDILRRKQPKTRCPICGNIIDYEYTNYDPMEAEKLYNSLSTELSYLQEQLDLVNSTIKFEI